MVTRQYECAACGYFEHQHRLEDESLRKCPQCGGKCWRVWKEMPQVWWVGWPYLRDADLGPHVHG